MSEELMITKEDLVNWLDRSPSNDDLDLIGFITTRLENFYKLEQGNKQLKEELQQFQYDFEKQEAEVFNELEQAINELDLTDKTKEYLIDKTKEYLIELMNKDVIIVFGIVEDKIQELKEKYK